MSPVATLNFSLLDADSFSLHLAHPTQEEKIATWKLNSAAWGKALNLESYVKREECMMNAPLARNGGITYWILVDKNLPPNERPILASCESIQKPAFVSEDGSIVEVISHGIGSVFCNPAHRGRGYASRMMTELGKMLQTWHRDTKACMFSVLWSDIGKRFYTARGWHPFPSTHIEFPVSLTLANSPAKILELKDLEKLCEDDVTLIRRTLASARDGKVHVAIVPDFEQMQWHHFREDYMCQHVLGRKPSIRGAIIGEPGHRIWANWSRTFYGPLDGPYGNTLHILRLVIEDEIPPCSFSSKSSGPIIHGGKLERQAEALRAVLGVAQAQAVEAKLFRMELWNPSPLVQTLVKKTGLVHSMVQRENDSISSLMWYGEGSGKMDEIEWVGNEKYGWN